MIVNGKKDLLFIGPFVGEFGHELFSWQAYARKFSRSFKHIIACSRKEYKFLYEDFIDEFVEINPGTFNAGTYEVIENRDQVLKMCKKLQSKYNINKQYTILTPNNHKEIEIFKCLQKIGTEYKIYGNFNENLKYDIIIHARNFQNCTGKWSVNKKSRDWSFGKWNRLAFELKKMGLRVASIGLSNHAYHVKETDNLLDKPLSELADILRSSKYILGPSSGPMHFATLCKCKQIVWSHPCNKERYLREWNPFNVDVTFYDKELWNPKVQTVKKLVEQNL